MGRAPHHGETCRLRLLLRILTFLSKNVDGAKLASNYYLSLSLKSSQIASQLQKIYRKNAWGGLPIMGRPSLPMRIS